ncbi:uncharacterized protein LOC114277815 isoform X3 [Camellia sinensis]|uniref:uncharacterized protein LOC114277815 isoform X3 n=1 Tax=Camellia sinensis TaxID=4442 RepID=UPI0010369D0C|nr:uncharacterized protein LOC114277815 isoform X3 [Camellia sinensis]
MVFWDLLQFSTMYSFIFPLCSLYCCNGLGCFCFNFHQGDNVPPYLTSFELWVFLQSFFERCNIYFKNYIFRLSRRDHFSQSLLRRMFSQGIEAGIAVIGHVGLTPQAISVLGGFRAQGKNIGSWVLFCCSEMCAYTCCCCCNICSSNPYHRYWGRNFL